MASALFATFLDRLVKIPNDSESCWAIFETHNGYFLEVYRDGDAYLVSHWSDRDADPDSQYVAEAHQMRSILSQIPIEALPKKMSLYKDGYPIDIKTM